MSKPNIFEIVIDSLNRTAARYVIVGGFAVNLHGYQRFTSDIDVGIDLGLRSSQLLVQALFDIGFKPRVPVSAEDFGDETKRKDWIENKHAKVISFVHLDHPTFAVDVFIDPPIDFDELYASSFVVPIGTISVRIASIQSLLKMKRLAGRDKDLIDIKMLEKILSTKKD